MIAVSCVVLNFGYADFVVDCLASIDRSAHRGDVEVILVDNGSSVADLARLKRELEIRGIAPDILVELPVNAGFASGMNAGIAIARGNVVIAANSDTIVGTGVLPSIARAAQVNPESGFFAIPVYHAPLERGRLKPGKEIQAEVVGLTWYVSCMPVTAATLSSHFVLGPPGCFVAMSRRLIDALMLKYGCVYDPHFFLYGEDVDLFLRARQAGFKTSILSGGPATDDVVWHAGSASTSEGSIATIRKSPAVAAMILDGFLDNAIHHASYLELPAFVLLTAVFRCVFCLGYLRAHSWHSLLELARSKRRPMPAQVSRSRPIRPRLLPQIALLHTRPFPWARAQRDRP